MSAGALPQTPLGELTALPQTPWLDLRGLLLREGREWEGEGERQGKGEGGNRKGREEGMRKGREGRKEKRGGEGGKGRVPPPFLKS